MKESSLSLVCLVETHVRAVNKDGIIKNVFKDWNTFDNLNCHHLGKIFVGWNPNILDVTKLFESDQLMHCQICIVETKACFFASFVYGSNLERERDALWGDMGSHMPIGVPWIVLGDFNVARRTLDSYGSSSSISPAMVEFEDCLQRCGLDDLRFSGLFYTWCNKRSDGDCISKKLDRVLVNDVWLTDFPNSEAVFLPPSLSDHSPSLVRMGLPRKRRKCPFKFFNFMSEREEFIPIVQNCWNRQVHGTLQFQLCTKLRMVKNALKTLNNDVIGDVTIKVKEAKVILDDCQRLLDVHPDDSSLRSQEREFAKNYSLALQMEEDFLKQKSRVQWLKGGDRNSSYFFKAINGRRNRNKIISITGEDGSLIENEEGIKEAAIHYFKDIMGGTHSSIASDFNIPSLFNNHISQDQATAMTRDVTHDEIRDVCFSLHSNKAPGPDGFNAHFFKKTWDIIGRDVIGAVLEFFHTGHLLKEINATILALVPKVQNPTLMKDFRPIACCNTLYKIIAKIIANRIKVVLPDIIGSSQSAFVKGRKIGDNILLVQELMRDYHKNVGSPKCALKVDLMKAFDMVDWGFIMETLAALHFPLQIRQWIKACITTPKFSININGELAGFFNAKRGLRQGDPMSPYLFVIAMEVLSKLLSKSIHDAPNFKYHWKCDKVKLSHLCFADDLILLCHGSYDSALALKKAIDDFSAISGLKANPLKSNIFLTSVPPDIKQQIVDLFGYSMGSLPIRYLGIPIISTKLKLADCSPLIDKVSSRIASWMNRCLSFAGRLQLIISVLSSVQVYWASHLILPTKVLRIVEQKLCSFLWKGTDTNSMGAKVAWKEVCTPKKSGGLGIKDLVSWNKALMIRHIWNLYSGVDSLWVRWINSYHLKNRNFWDGKAPHLCSWNWRKILKLRHLARPLIKHSIGNGVSTSLWFDDWHPDGPLLSKWSSRIIYDSGLPKHAKVSSIIHNNLWNWPPTVSIDLLEIRNNMPCYNPNQTIDDSITWVPTSNGIYTAASALKHIKPDPPSVPWFKLVWFPQNIPRMSFILWLAIRGRLSTTDRFHAPNASTTCILCSSYMESHSHLFFDCDFSRSVWSHLMNMCGSPWNGSDWFSFIDWAAIHWKGTSLPIKVKKLCLGGAVYAIWRERNNRLFGGSKKTSLMVTRDIINVIRNRLISLDLRPWPGIASTWNVPTP